MYASGATQAYMEMKIKVHLQKAQAKILEESISKSYATEKSRKPMDLESTIYISTSTTRSFMSKFATKKNVPDTPKEVYYHEYDTTNLRNILDRCGIFDGWVSHDVG